LLVMAALCVLTFALVLLVRGELRRFLSLVAILPPLVLGTFFWAAWEGGESVTRRLETLVEASPDQIYQRNRGEFLMSTLRALPAIPLGIGLGHWGMTSAYFGEAALRPWDVWVEIQLTGWLYDGGVPLILAYGAAIALTVWVAWRIARRSSRGTL